MHYLVFKFNTYHDVASNADKQNITHPIHQHYSLFSHLIRKPILSSRFTILFHIRIVFLFTIQGEEKKNSKFFK